MFPQQPKNKHTEDRLKPFKTHLANVSAMPSQEEMNSIWERTDDYVKEKGERQGVLSITNEIEHFQRKKNPLIWNDIRRKLTPFVSCHFFMSEYKKKYLLVVIFSDFTNTRALNSSMLNQRVRFHLPKKLTTCITTNKNHLQHHTSIQSCESTKQVSVQIKTLVYK